MHREDSAAIADAGRVIFELYDRFVYLRAYVWMGRRDKVAQSLNRLICLLERVRCALLNHELLAAFRRDHLLNWHIAMMLVPGDCVRAMVRNLGIEPGMQC